MIDANLLTGAKQLSEVKSSKGIVFVVVPVFQRFKFTNQCIQQLLQQTYPDLKIIISDGGSKDGSYERLKDHYPQLNFVQSKVEMWWGGTVAQGMELALRQSQSDDDFLLMLNDDTLFDKDFVERLAQLAQKNQAAIQPVYISQEDPTQILDAGARLDWDTYAFKFKDIESDEKHIEIETQLDFDVDVLPGRGSIFPIWMLRKYGIVDYRRFPHYIGDYEFSARLKNFGCKLAVATNIFIRGYSKETGYYFHPSMSLSMLFRSLLSKRSLSNIFDHSRFILSSAPQKQKWTILFFYWKSQGRQFLNILRSRMRIFKDSSKGIGRTLLYYRRKWREFPEHFCWKYIPPLIYHCPVFIKLFFQSLTLSKLTEVSYRRIPFLIDPHGSGHRLAYLRRFSHFLLQTEKQIVVITPEFEELKKLLVRDGVDKSRIIAYAPVERRESKSKSSYVYSFLYAVSFWLSLGKTIEKISIQEGVLPRFVFMSWLDCYLSQPLAGAMVDIFFPFNWGGVYFHPKYFRDPKGNLRNTNTLRSGYCRWVAVLDSFVQKDMALLLGKPVIVLPDFTDCNLPNKSSEFVLDILRRAGNKKIVLMIGSIEKRKNLLTFLQMVEKTTSSDLYFVVAGLLAKNSFSPSELEYIANVEKRYPEKLALRTERFIESEEDINELIHHSAVVYLVYQNFLHSSNILTKAGLLERPVLVCNQSLMGDLVSTYRTGLVVDAHAPSEQQLQRLEELVISGTPNADWQGFKMLYSQEALTEALDDIDQVISLITPSFH